MNSSALDWKEKKKRENSCNKLMMMKCEAIILSVTNAEHSTHNFNLGQTSKTFSLHLNENNNILWP